MTTTHLAERLLFDAIQWCSLSTSKADLLDRLWSAALLPNGVREAARPSLYGCDTVEERIGLVRAIADRRVALLRAEPRDLARPARGLARGRLLLYAPDDSLADGAAAAASKRFFADDNAPPWGAWLWYIADEARTKENERRIREARHSTPWKPVRYTSYLVSWVPSKLMKLADAGIRANPEGCIAWADEALGISDEEILLSAQDQEVGAAASRSCGWRIESPASLTPYSIHRVILPCGCGAASRASAASTSCARRAALSPRNPGHDSRASATLTSLARWTGSGTIPVPGSRMIPGQMKRLLHEVMA